MLISSSVCSIKRRSTSSLVIICTHEIRSFHLYTYISKTTIVFWFLSPFSNFRFHRVRQRKLIIFRILKFGLISNVKNVFLFVNVVPSGLIRDNIVFVGLYWLLYVCTLTCQFLFHLLVFLKRLIFWFLRHLVVTRTFLGAHVCCLLCSLR